MKLSKGIENIEKQVTAFVLRASHGNTAVVENLNRALDNLTLLFEDQELKFHPVSHYPNRGDLHFSVSGKRNSTGLAHAKIHSVLGEESV